MKSTEERFWEKVDASGSCWLWTAAKMQAGYGVFGVTHARVVLAHRFAWEWLVGPIPQGLELDHLCRVPQCVNPDHLEPVTPRVNKLRGQSPSALHARKTHCPQGHPYAGRNLYVAPSGQRGCRECNRANQRRRKAAA
jgi:hypothetical protein